MLDAQGKPLSVREALALINQTLDEEKHADQKLNEIAMSDVNQTALKAAA